ADPKSITFDVSRAKVLNDFLSLNAGEGKPLFNQFLLVRSDGVIQVASNQSWEGVDLKNTELGIDLEKQQATTITYFNLPPLYPNELVAITIQPYHVTSGEVVGTLLGITEEQNLREYLQPLIDLSPSTDAYFVSSSGILVGSDPYTEELMQAQTSPQQKQQLDNAFGKLMTQKSESPPVALEFPLVDGRDVIAQAKWLPGMDAGIVLQIHTTTILGEINSLVPFTILIVLVALLGMALAISAGINRFINPIRGLAEITRHFAEGNLGARAPVNSNDEIGLLAYSFNQMADELGTLYRSLEQKVDERTRQIRTAAEVAQGISASSNLNELMNRTTRLIVERFGFYHAAIYMLDRSGKYAVVRSAYGPAAKEFLESNYSLEVGSKSIIGWASENNQPRVASDVVEDPIHLKHNLLANTRAEAGIPISSGDLIFGVLDVQSAEPNAFDGETIIVLQTLANQIAAAINNSSLVESTQINFQELERLYRSSRLIAQAKTMPEVLTVVNNALKDAPYISAVFRARGNQFDLISVNDPQNKMGTATLPRTINLLPAEVARGLAGESIFDLKTASAPLELMRVPTVLGCRYVAYLPIMRDNEISLLLMIGSISEPLNRTVLQPYLNMADLTAITLEKVAVAEATDERLRELNALTTVGQIVSSASDTSTLYATLHEQIRSIIGDFNFSVALYDEKTDTIQQPYTYEDGKAISISPLPLGEGLISILIHSMQPVMLVQDVEQRASAMGARTTGRPAKSWMGAPMILNNKVIGALILQDLDREFVFTENNLKFLSAMAMQVAGAIDNIRLLEDSRLRAVQLETAAEIARDISSSLNLDELLAKAVNLIRERFNFYHAAVFLLDLPREFAVIREATGEAGAQMKRQNHKLGVGSKSIVGYAAGRGEALVINDTEKDPTYYANPLLPDTRAEAATPLKVGERILGVLDVQSTRAYAFNDDNLRTLQILADQLAIAVVNSELFSETQEHLSQHRLLHHITTTAASGTTLEEALSSAVNGLQVTLGGDRVSILLLDRDRKELQLKASVGYSEEANQIRVEVGSGVTGWVAAHRRPLRVDDVSEEPRYIQISANTASELAVPLIYRNELLGVLNVESEQPGAYTDNDEEMLGTLGGSLAAVIANARLLEQIRTQAERERLLYEVTSKIRRSTDIQTILATTASELTKAVRARRTQIKIEPATEAKGTEHNGHEADEQ
ncbi:MAG TPA: GAF domain-containing protein, partial [Anaerolineales bacterium]|nr:GAF domain-containing protein [Anaerolineales bacterium]